MIWLLFNKKIKVVYIYLMQRGLISILKKKIRQTGGVAFYLTDIVDFVPYEFYPLPSQPRELMDPVTRTIII
jgi:hypothetical protein